MKRNIFGTITVYFLTAVVLLCVVATITLATSSNQVLPDVGKAYHGVLSAAVNDYGIAPSQDPTGDFYGAKWDAALSEWEGKQRSGVYAGQGIYRAELIYFGDSAVPQLLFVYDSGYGPGRYICSALVYGYSAGAAPYSANSRESGYTIGGDNPYGSLYLVTDRNGLIYLHHVWNGSDFDDDYNDIPYLDEKYLTVKNGQWVEVPAREINVASSRGFEYSPDTVRSVLAELQSMQNTSAHTQTQTQTQTPSQPQRPTTELMSSTNRTSGGTDDITVYVNDVRLQFDQPPIIENGRTLVPMRAIFEVLGCTVDWYAPTQTIFAVTEYGEVITLSIGDNLMTVKHDEVYLDVPPKLVNGRTLVPVRAISEALGAEVSWHGPSSSVFIFYRFVEGGEYIGWGDSSPYEDYPGDHSDEGYYDDEPEPPGHILQKYSQVRVNMPLDDVTAILGPLLLGGSDEYTYFYYCYIEEFTIKISVNRATMKISGTSLYPTNMSWKYDA